MIGDRPYLCLFALRDITVGTEICYDYGPDDTEKMHAEFRIR